MGTFFAQCETFERSQPLFIKEEFEAFLRCGILAHGFARIYCKDCRYDRLVAFSCKKRGSVELSIKGGFKLHASIAIAAEDRQGLERLLRYMGRPPLSEDRLAKTKDGKLILRLKTPWGDGTSKIILSPLELIERLVALIPPPRKHMIRYAGV